MDPIMLQLGPLALRWYGLFIALGVLIGSIWATRLAERRGLDPEKILDMAVWLVVAGIIGARLVYVLTSPSAFFGPGGDPISSLYIWQGGISIHGGVIGIVIATWIYSRIHHLNMWAYLDVMTPVAGLGIIGGRLGNFMNGTDTGGRLTDWPIAFTWPQPGTPTLGAFGRFVFGDNLWAYYPPACAEPFALGQPCHIHLTQGYGVIIGILLLFITVWALRRSRTPGYAFWQMVLWYSVLRSVIEEPFRDNPLTWQVYLNNEAGIGLFTLTQLISVLLILLSLYMLFTLDPDRTDKKERLAMKARGR